MAGIKEHNGRGRRLAITDLLLYFSSSEKKQTPTIIRELCDVPKNTTLAFENIGRRCVDTQGVRFLTYLSLLPCGKIPCQIAVLILRAIQISYDAFGSQRALFSLLFFCNSRPLILFI